MSWALWASLLLTSSAIAATTSAEEHLLAGARFFKEGRFAEALVEFRVAQNAGSGQALWYAGAALQKLGRSEEAIEAFAAADPAGHDSLLDYYRALACYDVRLYLCADRLLASVGERSGPRIAVLVREVRAKIALALRGGPSTEAIDWYHQRATEVGPGRKLLATAYLEEALALANLRADHYREADARAALRQLRRAPGVGVQ